MSWVERGARAREEAELFFLSCSLCDVLASPRSPDCYWSLLRLRAWFLLPAPAALTDAFVQSTEHDARRAEELLALDRIKTSFFANVSHELRTPLTLILGPLDDVLNSKDTLQPHDRERLITVQRHANRCVALSPSAARIELIRLCRLLNMVNTLLDFSRLEGGRFEVTYRPTLYAVFSLPAPLVLTRFASSIAAVTTDLASLFRAAIERGKIEFVVDCEEDPSDGRPVYLAAELWEKIVFNLIGNSFKYEEFLGQWEGGTWTDWALGTRWRVGSRFEFASAPRKLCCRSSILGMLEILSSCSGSLLIAMQVRDRGEGAWAHL